MPVVVKEAATDLHRGPVLVSVEYILSFQNAKRSSWKRSINMLASGVAMGLIGGVSTEILNNTSDTSKLTTSWKDAYSGYAASDPMVRHLIYANSIET